MKPFDEWKSLLSDCDLARAAPAAAREIAEAPVALIEQAARRAGIVEFLRAASLDPDPLIIAVNDTHRFTDSRSAIEAVCRICEAEGLAPRFRLLVATGSHTFSNPEEVARHEQSVLGERGSLFVERSWHEAQNASALKAAGGARMHRWIADGRFALAVGSMEPHYFAGVTGAHKTLTTGVLSFENLTANHQAALGGEARGLRLRGNPIYEGLAAILRRLEAEGRRFFALNEILLEGHVVHCAAGRPLESVEQSLPLVSRMFACAVAQPMDFVVSLVGPPLDRDLYQADKGIKNVEHAVRDGGAILLEAPCRGGVGIDRFFHLLRRAATHAESVALVEREGYALGDHKAVRLRALTDGRRVRLGAIAPGLCVADAAIAGIALFPDRASAARWIRECAGPRARGVLVEDAGNVTLEIRAE
ncbi:MAG: lactate racemase domain-containing protein [Candidatus Sumerlaeota bacterium]|nr:lactate racemase domain-containing protein [Candidatus Sumerlaeota bacterium]